jgi:hypothetical protein
LCAIEEFIQTNMDECNLDWDIYEATNNPIHGDESDNNDSNDESDDDNSIDDN